MHLVLALFFLSWPALSAHASPQFQNDIYTPNQSGEKVVAKVVELVEGALGSTSNLLRRTAWVESKFGSDPGTFRVGYHGGIWQVDEIGFKDTQDTKSHPGLKRAYKAIKDKFGINWPNVDYYDLRKPLYSGLAARLKYRNVPALIPSDLRGQAKYWKRYYNTYQGKGTVEKFLRDVSRMP